MTKKNHPHDEERAKVPPPAAPPPPPAVEEKSDTPMPPLNAFVMRAAAPAAPPEPARTAPKGREAHAAWVKARNDAARKGGPKAAPAAAPRPLHRFPWEK